jgi:hypothetical protein
VGAGVPVNPRWIYRFRSTERMTRPNSLITPVGDRPSAEAFDAVYLVIAASDASQVTVCCRNRLREPPPPSADVHCSPGLLKSS